MISVFSCFLLICHLNCSKGKVRYERQNKVFLNIFWIPSVVILLAKSRRCTKCDQSLKWLKSIPSIVNVQCEVMLWCTRKAHHVANFSANGFSVSYSNCLYQWSLVFKCYHSSLSMSCCNAHSPTNIINFFLLKMLNV